MEVVPLHRNSKFTNACAEILNKQWPRSMGARLHSLSKSCDTYPVALALVHNGDVIGFSKLVAVQGKLNSCLTESVIIRESDRGKGLGRTLMELTENYAKSLGTKTIYLNTLDKEGFYEHLGYMKCKPVISLGENAHRVPDALLQRFLADSLNDVEGDKMKSEREISCNEMCTSETISDSSTASVLNPPPPPPPPPSLPIPRPPLPASGQKPVVQKNLNHTITRLDPKSVIWMKKDLL